MISIDIFLFLDLKYIVFLGMFFIIFWLMKVILNFVLNRKVGEVLYGRGLFKFFMRVIVFVEGDLLYNLFIVYIKLGLDCLMIYKK